MMTNDIEWKMVKLGDVCTMPTKTISSNTFETRFYVGTENMLQNCFGIIDNEISISTVRVREYKKDDILMSNIRPYLKKIWFSDKNAGCSTDVNIFRTNGKCFPKYLFHVLCQDDFFNYVNDNAIGTKMPRGDKSLIPNFFIPLPYKNGAPDLETQKQIAQKLGDMDSLIAAKEKHLAKKRNLKVATMQKLIKDEEGENWKKVKLGEVCKGKISSGKTTEYFDIGSFFVYGSTDVIGFTTKPKYEGEKILIARVGENAGFLQKVSGKYGVTDNTLIFTPKEKINTEFIFFVLETQHLNDFAFGSGQPLITGKQLYNLEIFLPYKNGTPDFNEQRRIASILSDMDCEIAAIEKGIIKLQNLKTAMMQKMFCFEDSDSSSE